MAVVSLFERVHFLRVGFVIFVACTRLDVNIIIVADEKLKKIPYLSKNRYCFHIWTRHKFVGVFLSFSVPETPCVSVIIYFGKQTDASYVII